MLAGEIGQPLPPALASAAAAARALPGTIAAWSAGMPGTIAAAARPPLSRPVAGTAGSVTRPTKPRRRPATTSPRCTHGTTAVTEARSWFVAVELAAAAAARLANREVGLLALGDLAFRTRQRRANQPAVHRPVFLRRRGLNGDCVCIGTFSRLCPGIVSSRRRFNECAGCCVVGTGLSACRLFDGLVFLSRRARTQDALWTLAAAGVGALAARRRHLGGLVLVVRVTRRTARLLHLVINHRHHGVIGNAALARAIVVQNVTQPKPALLHQTLRSRSFQVG